MPLRIRHAALAAPFVLLSCSSDDAPPAGSPPPSAGCAPIQSCLVAGDPDGHPEPQGARAAGQARAGRIKDASLIRQPADARQKVRVGDFVIANDRIAAYIEDRGVSDGYARFGGEILAIDPVGDDGLPLGVSRYGETLLALSSEMIDPESVSVIADGSDGKAAIVRVLGHLKSIPFLGSLKALFPREYGFLAAYDYVLEPGSDKLVIRLGVENGSEERADFQFDEMHGFFHYSRNRLYTPETAYGEPAGEVSWVGFDGGDAGFAWRSPGQKLGFAANLSGFQYFTGKGFVVEPGQTVFRDHVEVIAGGPELDGLLAAVRRADGDESFREVKGKVADASGKGVDGAFVHLVAPDGKYLSRTRAAADGSFTIDAPPSEARLVATAPGFPPHAGATLAAGATTADLAFAPHGTVRVHARDAATGAPLPVRVQVIPSAEIPSPPAEYGVSNEANGRLHQRFAVDGEAELVVPPGEHRIVVSRGYEWELLDQTVTVAAGEVAEVTAPLAHSVDTTGFLCADFHIHSFFSADSSDPAEHKLKGAVADGLDIPVSSEHEWVIDFQPIIEQLGLQKWAFGVPSEELTTFTWGHFGVLPLLPKPDQVNSGAIDWIGKDPPEVFTDVHAQAEKPVLIVNHPSGGGFGAYFSAAQLDRKTGVGKPKMWSDAFEAVEVFNDSGFDENRTKSVADWFSLLERGRDVWAVGSSDSHHVRTSPVGYPRTCLYFGHDDPTKLTPEAVRDGVASGASTISGGLYLTVKGPNGVGPGQTAKGVGASAKLEVTVRATSWIEAETLEVIVNGATVTELPLTASGGGPAHVYQAEVEVPVDASRARSWVVLHARGKGDLSPLHPGREPFAVSNPIFLVPLPSPVPRNGEPTASLSVERHRQTASSNPRNPTPAPAGNAARSAKHLAPPPHRRTHSCFGGSPCAVQPSHTSPAR